MAKLTLTDMASFVNDSSAVATMNANFALIEAALENTISIDGTTPNSMEASFDLNSNRLINVADGVSGTDGINLSQLNAVVIAAGNTFAGLLDTPSTYVGSELYHVRVNAAGTALEFITAAASGLQNIVEDLTPQLGGALDTNAFGINMADTVLSRPAIIDYGITHTAPSSSSGTLVLDMALGNSFSVTLTENVTTVTLSNPPATGTFGELVVLFTQDGTGSRTVTWPASVNWPGGTAPVITAAAASVDQVVLNTRDAGTTWYGNFSQDYS